MTSDLVQNGATSGKLQPLVDCMPCRDVDARFSNTKQNRENSFKPANLFPRPFLIIAGVAFAVICPFFLLGILAGHDFAFHMNSWMEVAAQWKQGIIYPRWAALANYGYGEPRFIFYPPISWMLGALLGNIFPWKLVPGVYIWISLALSGCSMFCLARTWLGRRDAIFAAALYATNPYYLVIIYWRSDFAELLAGALLPLLMLFLSQAPEKGSRPLVFLSLIVAGAWLTNAPVAVMVNYLVALLTVSIAVSRRSLRAVAVGISAVVLGAGLAGFYILPAAYEQRWITIGQILASGFRPLDNFLFTATGDIGHDAFNRLLTMVALTEMAIVALGLLFVRRPRAIPKGSLVLLLMLSVTTSLLMFSVTSPLWTFLPKLQFLQFPWRWLLCLSVVFALVVASAWPSTIVRVALYVGMIAMLTFGAWRIQRPWKDSGADIARMAEMQRGGRGYKSRPEYLPIAADLTTVDQNATLASFVGNGETCIEAQTWSAENKIIVLNSSQPGRVALRLFNYPGWRAYVNERPVQIEALATTGQISIWVPPGEAQIRLKFQSTFDRLWGAAISALVFVALAFYLTFSNCRTKRQEKSSA